MESKTIFDKAMDDLNAIFKVDKEKCRKEAEKDDSFEFKLSDLTARFIKTLRRIMNNYEE